MIKWYINANHLLHIVCLTSFMLQTDDIKSRIVTINMLIVLDDQIKVLLHIICKLPSSLLPMKWVFSYYLGRQPKAANLKLTAISDIIACPVIFATNSQFTQWLILLPSTFVSFLGQLYNFALFRESHLTSSVLELLVKCYDQ